MTPSCQQRNTTRRELLHCPIDCVRFCAVPVQTSICSRLWPVLQARCRRSRSARGSGAARPTAPARRVCSVRVRPHRTRSIASLGATVAVLCRPVLPVRERRRMRRAAVLRDGRLHRLPHGGARRQRNAARRDRQLGVLVEDHARVRYAVFGRRVSRCMQVHRTRKYL